MVLSFHVRMEFYPWSVEYEIYWRVISPDQQKISPADILFSNLIISTTTGETKKLLTFSENLGNEALYCLVFRSISLIVFEQHSFEKKCPK